MSHCWGGRGVIAPESERVLIGLAQHGPWALTHAPPALREDRDFILQAVAINGDSLMFVPEQFKSDRELVLAAIQQNGNALRLVPPPLSEDRDFLLESISLSPKGALHAPAALRNDFDFMLDAIQRGAPLKYASSNLQANLRLKVAEEARNAWDVKRQELLGTMSSAASTKDFKLLGQALQEAEDILLPVSDIGDHRNLLASLDTYNAFSSLWECLRTEAGHDFPPIVLVKGSWLERFASSNESAGLPRRQDLPQEALWNCDELIQDIASYDQGQHRRPPQLVSISYCWLSKGQPDPQGSQLKLLSWLIQRRLREHGSADLAIFIDYCSLFQLGESGEPRNHEEQYLFDRGLSFVNLWYAHDKVEKWLLTSSKPFSALRLPTETSLSGDLPHKMPEESSTSRPPSALHSPPEVLPYSARGWPTFERALAELLACERARSTVLDIGTLVAFDDNLEWHEIHRQCSLYRQPPQTPERLSADLDKKTFTNNADACLVKKKYEITFEEVFSAAQHLVYRNLSWGSKEASVCAISLRLCSGLRTLDLGNNQIGDDGVIDIVNAICECAAISRLSLAANQIGDRGAQHIAVVLPKCASLKLLDLSFNLIGNAGIKHLVEMFETLVIAHPAWQEFRLHGNDVGLAGERDLRTVSQARQGTNFKLQI